MLGMNIWKSFSGLLNLGVLTEADLREAKDTFPLGTIKQYGKEHLYVKVGGDKKPWVYYATLGTDKADAAIKAGGCVVINGKAVGPASQDNLTKYNVKHPHEGGTPPPLDPKAVAPAVPAAGPSTGPAAAGGVVSPVPVPSQPKIPRSPKVPKVSAEQEVAAELSKTADELSATAKTPEEYMAALKAQIAAYNAHDVLGDALAPVHLAAMHAMAKAHTAATADKLAIASDASTHADTLTSTADTAAEHDAAAAAHQIAYDAYAVLPGQEAGAEYHQKLVKSHGLSSYAKKNQQDLAALNAKQLGTKADQLSTVAKTPEDHDVAGKAHIAAHNAYLALSKATGVNAPASDIAQKLTHHENELLKQIEAKKHKKALADADALSQVATDLSATAVTHQDHGAAAHAHVVAKEAYQALGDDNAAAFHDGKAIAEFEKKFQKKVPTWPTSGWASFPNPTTAQKSIATFVQLLDTSGGSVSDDDAKAHSTIFGPDWKKVYDLAKTVQNLSTPPGATEPDPEGMIKNAAKYPGMEQKLLKLYGKDWKERALAIGLALKDAGMLAPKATALAASPAPVFTIAPPVVPAPSPSVATTPSLVAMVQHMVGSVSDSESLEVLDKLVADHPALKDQLEKLTGLNYKTAALLAKQLVTAGMAKVAQKHAASAPVLKNAIINLAGELGLGPSTAPVPASAPSVPVPVSSGAVLAVHVPKKGVAYQAIKKINFPLDSNGAKVVALLHAFGDYDMVVKKIKEQGFTADEATDMVDMTVQAAMAAKAFDWDADQGVPTFHTKTKSSPVSPVAAPPFVPATSPPSIPTASEVPSALPALFDLKLKGDAKHLGGAGQKSIYVDKQGKEYLFKVAASKNGSKVEPHRAEVQAAFSAIARKVKPDHPPVGVVTADGKLGTLYPFIPAKGHLKGIAPSALTDVEKYDVATEHVLDWLGSQHDSHGANLLRTDDGRVVGIDKEQGFKYFPNDKLSIDYHPNSQYGESEPYYNKFWRDWSEDKFAFDPQTLAAPLKKLEDISPAEYVKTLRPYAESRAKDSYSKDLFLRQALNRKLTLRRDYEKFVSDLYEKRTKQKGTFTFDSGWIPEGTQAKPKTKIVTQSGADYAQVRGIKVRDFEKNDGTKDPTKITLKIPKSSGSSDLEDTLKELGVTPLGEIKQGGNNYLVYVSRAEFEASKITKEVIIEDPKNGKLAPHAGSPSYYPAIPLPAPADPNVEELKKTADSKSLGIHGQRINLDGGAVESQVAKVKRMKDSSGIFYMVHFKLRRPTWEKIKGGTDSSFGLFQGDYDEKTDTLTESGSSPAISMPTKKWDVGDNELYLARGNAPWSYMGGVYTKIRPKAGQSVESALAELLDAAKPGLSKQVLRVPTAEEREVSKLSRLLWNVAPQSSDEQDKLPESERTVSNLMTRLKQSGISDDDIANMREVEFLPGHSTYVIPGRWKKLAKTSSGQPAVRYLQFSASTPSRIVSQVKNGLLGIHERALTGQAYFGASASADVATGCADGCTIRLITQSGDGHKVSDGWGTYQIIIAPDECDRLDVHMFSGDTYGCTNPNHATYGDTYEGRKSLAGAIQQQQDSYSSSAEIVTRRGVSSKKFVRIGADSEPLRQQLIAELKKEGITEVNGVPVEDFVVVPGTKGDMYKQYVQPLGF